MFCAQEIARHRWAVVELFARDQSALFFQSSSLTDVTAVFAAAQKIHLLVANTIITGLQIRCRPSLSGNTNGSTSVPPGAHLSDMGAVHSNMHPSACF